MVDRFTTAPMELPTADHDFSRADLIFYEVDHSGSSFEARIFPNEPEADQQTGADHPAYAGRFFILGHGGCFGDVGHCDVPATRDHYDPRPPHQLTPAIRVVTVTDAVKSL